ncbi:hypothetical protein [Marinicella sp. W31]|uniref:hypothetical protein n=1 Tax=Marinicella sp. W31 TaxID=3023713 RepID=UPI003757B4BB
MEKCKFCGNECTSQLVHSHSDNMAIDCSLCGKYLMDECLYDDFTLDESKLYVVSSWIREKNDELKKNGLKKYPTINNSKLNEIINLRKKSIQEKFDLMMGNLYLSLNIDKYLMTRCWSKDETEFENLFQKSIDLGYVNGSVSGITDKMYTVHGLTFDGLEYIESLEEPNKSSKKIFVAFNFEDNMISIFNSYVRKAIEDLNFIYTVVNQNNSSHDKAISDEIIATLKSCKILIADFSNQRNSVYFEAGFAMGMGIPIIWTCHEDHIEELSFDTRQFPHIVWKDGEDLQQQIMNRIRVIV